MASSSQAATSAPGANQMKDVSLVEMEAMCAKALKVLGDKGDGIKLPVEAGLLAQLQAAAAKYDEQGQASSPAANPSSSRPGLSVATRLVHPKSKARRFFCGG